MPASILNQAQLDEMAEMRERGASYRAIADHFRATGTHVSISLVQAQCVRLGALPPNPTPRPKVARSDYHRGGRLVRVFTAEEDAQVLALEGKGNGPAAIGRALNRSPHAVLHRLRALARHDELASLMGEEA